MYDKQVVRRRRAALAVLVALSIGLLTVYFGEGPGGLLHGFQRGAQEVLQPIETGVSRATKPFRDLVGWVGDNINAKCENDKLKQENADLREQVARAQAAEDENRKLRGLVDLPEKPGYPDGVDAAHRARDRPLADRLVGGRADRRGLAPTASASTSRSSRTAAWSAASRASPAAPPRSR